MKNVFLTKSALAYSYHQNVVKSLNCPPSEHFERGRAGELQFCATPAEISMDRYLSKSGHDDDHDDHHQRKVSLYYFWRQLSFHPMAGELSFTMF